MRQRPLLRSNSGEAMRAVVGDVRAPAASATGCPATRQGEDRRGAEEAFQPVVVEAHAQAEAAAAGRRRQCCPNAGLLLVSLEPSVLVFRGPPGRTVGVKYRLNRVLSCG